MADGGGGILGTGIGKGEEKPQFSGSVSGTTVGDKAKHPRVNITLAELEAYRNTGADIEKLSAGLNGNLYSYNGATNAEDFDKEGIGPLTYYDTGGRNLTSEVQAFQAWKDKATTSLAESEAYLARVKDRPGRNQTLLTGAPGAQASGTLFSGVQPPAR